MKNSKALITYSALVALAISNLWHFPEAQAEIIGSGVCHSLDLPQQVSIKTIINNPHYSKALFNERQQPIALIRQSKTGDQFQIYDLKNNLVLTGKSKNQTNEQSIELYDCSGQSIGQIKHDVEKSFLTADASYRAEDQQGNLIFQSYKKSEGSRTIAVTDKNHAELGMLTVVRQEKKFEATMKNSASGDNALLIVATLKIYADTK